MFRPTWLGLRPRLPGILSERSYIPGTRPFAASDNVLIENLHDRQALPIMLRLKPGGKRDTHKGSLQHDDIIGKAAREVVAARTSASKGTKKGLLFRIHEVKLDEYVRLTRRLVTPLYPQDAQLIVSLLDLHPDFASANTGSHGKEPTLEILEAGTGHGALTLYLSRAVHAANAAISRPPDSASTTSSSTGNEAFDVGIASWKASRNAVIHSIEISARHSAHAEEIVRGFRQALYYSNVDFHVGSVGPWVMSELARRKNQPFLSHAFLDLPSTEDHLTAVTAALRVAGTVIVFNPSLTQIMDCLKKVKEEGLDLELEKVIELGVNGGTGGREWDLRSVMPRAAATATADDNVDVVEKTESVEIAEEAGDEAPRNVEDAQEEESGSDYASLDESPYQRSVRAVKMQQKTVWKMVCRPKVGELTVGGGFLGVFAKKRR